MPRRQHGNIRRLPSGNYQARYHSPSGSRPSKVFTTRADANAWLAMQYTDQLRGDWVDPRAGAVSLRQYANDWLKDKANIRPRTHEMYEDMMRLHIFPTLGDEQLGRISPPIVRRWYALLVTECALESRTPAKAYRLLNQILKTATADGVIARSPCNLKGAGVERSSERPIATVAEVEALADEIEPRYRLMVLLACWCGLRRGELIALRRGRIDIPNERVNVEEAVSELKHGERIFGPPKTEAGRRRVSIPSPLIPEIQRHLDAYVSPEGEALLFTGPQSGQSLRFATLDAAWTKARGAVGLSHLHFHDLRHTGATLAASTGASTKELMARLGHASPRAALIYQHATEQRDRTIADRLGALMTEPHDNVVSLQNAREGGLRARGGHDSDMPKTPGQKKGRSPGESRGAGEENRTPVLSLGS